MKKMKFLVLVAAGLLLAGCHKEPSEKASRTSNPTMKLVATSNPGSRPVGENETYCPPDPVGHAVVVHARPWTTDLCREARIVDIAKPLDGRVVKEATNAKGKLRAYIVEGAGLPEHQAAIVCIEDIRASKTFAVWGLPLPWRLISGLAWSDERYLQFDRWSQPHHGMHYLVDTASMKLAHATPFPDEFELSQQTER
jgi:hypothetical protein